MPRRVYIRVTGPWKQVSDRINIPAHHARRIKRMITSTERVNAVSQSQGNARVKRQNITQGKFQTLPGRIVVSRKIIRGKKGEPDRKSKQYFAAFDADEGKTRTSRTGEETRISLGHEPMHFRHEVFAHEHGLKRNEFGFLAGMEDGLFLSFMGPFRYSPNPHSLNKESGKKWMIALKEIKQPDIFNEQLKQFIESISHELQYHFDSKRTYMRAVIELNRDPKMRTVLRKLNSIPIEINENTNFTPMVDPKYWHRLQGILTIFEYMKHKGIEYHQRHPSSRTK